MMQKLAIILITLVTGVINAQSNYEKDMQKAFELWESNNSAEASNMFERIATTESGNWLPPYYAAQINIVNSFGEKDEDKLTAQLKKAQDLINNATAISKNNPEILVLQALLYTAWVAFDGATYGPTLSAKVTAIYEQAEQLAPNNPRVVYCKAEWGIGGAKYFGQDSAPFCSELERALDLFANFKPETPFYPDWGENRARMLLEACRK